MGNSSSQDPLPSRVERFRKGITEGPDLKVSKRILMFSGQESTDNLKQHYEERRMEARHHAADWAKQLAQELGPFTSAPKLAGLGALAVSVLIDIIFKSQPDETVENALQSVFANEKGSEVWDLIDECLKRYRMYLNNSKELRRDISRIEGQLSLALTKLKNSMVRDGYVSNEAVKVWVNGAAFHIQMQIHLVRLGGIQTCDPVQGLIREYKGNLDAVFKKHKEMIEKKCYIYIWDYVDDSELNSMYLATEEYMYDMGSLDYTTCFEVYYEQKYGRQKREILEHFTDVEENLLELVQQEGSLNVN